MPTGALSVHDSEPWHAFCILYRTEEDASTQQGIMTNEFTFVGENKDDDKQFLVLGDDGRYYEYDPLRESLEPVDLGDDNWDRSAPEIEEPGGGTPISPEDLAFD